MIRGDFLFRPNKSKIGSLLPRYVHIYYQVFRYEYYLSQLFTEIDTAHSDLDQAERLAELENQLRELDMAVGQVRIYLLGFHRTLASAQALVQGRIEIPHHIAKHKNPLLHGWGAIEYQRDEPDHLVDVHFNGVGGGI